MYNAGIAVTSPILANAVLSLIIHLSSPARRDECLRIPWRKVHIWIERKQPYDFSKSVISKLRPCLWCCGSMLCTLSKLPIFVHVGAKILVIMITIAPTSVLLLWHTSSVSYNGAYHRKLHFRIYRMHRYCFQPALIEYERVLQRFLRHAETAFVSGESLLWGEFCNMFSYKPKEREH